MRRFISGTGEGRKIVVIEQRGATMVVSRLQPDGTTSRTERQLGSESEARVASDHLARELIGRGFEEHGQAGRAASPRVAASKVGVAKKPATTRRPPAEEGSSRLLKALAEGAPAEPVLARLAPLPAVEASSPKASGDVAKAVLKKKRKKKKAKANSDALDKRVLAGIGLVGILLLGGLGFIVYDQFIRPPSIVGNWQGSMTEHEISKYLIHTSYGLILDEKHNAVMTVNKSTSKGTYTLKGNRLKLSLKAEDDEKLASALAVAAAATKKGPGAEAKPQAGDGEAADEDEEGAGGGGDAEEPTAPIDLGPVETEYKVSIGRRTLDLIDPATNKLVVQLIRFEDSPAVASSKPGSEGATAEASKDLAAEAAKADPAADAALAQELAPKDGAFRLKGPKGWTSDTGSRPDNTYSWVTLENGSAKVSIHADIQGSLMSGSDASRHDEPEGSEFAPVHRAHELYVKTAAEEFSEYKESKPVVIKSGLGEGRIALFNAAEGGILGSTKLRGYHATFLSRDRRVSILCRCPAKDFASTKATFLAICRGLAH
ncbi:hypothetical protein [Aquisphaera giovannonii]|nr:hypothetical protein [Aquisphaera giovannonii]